MDKNIIDEYVEALIKTTDDLEKKTIIENLNKIKNELDNIEDGILRRNILDYIISYKEKWTVKRIYKKYCKLF